MLRSPQEYCEYWRTDDWQYEKLTGESCIFFETGDSPMAEGCYPLPDFGHVICFYRYYRAPSKPQPQQERSTDIYDLLPGLALVEQLYGHSQPDITDDEFDVRWAATAQALDTLLAEFIEQGYKPEMSEHLRKIVRGSLIGFCPEEIFVLPDDRDDALSFLGNPLTDDDTYETWQEDEDHAPTFDWNNPEHCEALRKAIWAYGC